MREAAQAVFPSQSMSFFPPSLIQLCQYSNIKFQQKSIFFPEEQNLQALFIM